MNEHKGFSDRIENWLSKIPGIRTYRARENRRETDKRVREHLASRLHGAREDLKRLALELTKKGNLAPLSDVDRISAHAQQMADTIRYASYGYSGIFDLEKIREDELDQLYAFDLSLMEDIEGFVEEVPAMHADMPAEELDGSLRGLSEVLVDLEKKFRQRGDFLSKSA
jgi:hypothetical protein